MAKSILKKKAKVEVEEEIVPEAKPAVKAAAKKDDDVKRPVLKEKVKFEFEQHGRNNQSTTVKK